MPPNPVIFSVFANSNDHAYLEMLKEEYHALFDILAKLHPKVVYISYLDMKRTKLSDSLATYKKDLMLFHFGGHADGKGLEFADHKAYKEGVAQLLSLHPKLKLVFLNACDTYEQVHDFLAKSVPIVLATTYSVEDGRAKRFAEVFYQNIANDYSIQDAFLGAKGEAQLSEKFEGEGITIWRGPGSALETSDSARNPTAPWQLFVKDGQQALLDWKLSDEKDFGSEPTERPILMHHLALPPYQSKGFLGRSQELQAIRNKLSKGSGVLMINGEGGIGKSSLAAAYYHKFSKDYTYQAWLVADPDITDTLLRLALKLNVRFNREMSRDEQVEQLILRLADLPSPILLVLDNADERAQLQQCYNYLNRLDNVHCLITTRINVFDQNEMYTVAPLSLERAKDIFTYYYPNHQEQEDPLLEQLYCEIRGNTLLIKLLAKSLSQWNFVNTEYSLEDLLKDLRDKGVLSLRADAVLDNYLDNDPQQSDKLQDIILAMFKLDKLDQNEKKILSILAVLPPELIPLYSLQAFLPDNFPTNRILLDLWQKGWLNFSDSKKAFKISPVFQQVIRNKHKLLLEDCLDLVNSLIRLLDYEPGTGQILLGNHQLGVNYAHYAEIIINQNIPNPEALLALYERLGNFYRTTGNIPLALTYIEQQLQTAQQLYQSNSAHLSYRQSYGLALERMGNIHKSLGNYKVAIRYCTQYCEVCEAIILDHPDNPEYKNEYAIAYGKIGEAYFHFGHRNKAIKLLKIRNSIGQELVNAYPANTDYKNGLSISFNRLGKNYQVLGKPKLAQEMFEKHYQLSSELYTQMPQDVSFKNGMAIASGKLGEVYSFQGKFDKARALLNDNLQLSQQLYNNHLGNHNFQNGLAIAHAKNALLSVLQNEWEAAKTFLGEYLLLTRQIYSRGNQSVDFQAHYAKALATNAAIHQLLGLEPPFLEGYAEAQQIFEALRLNSGRSDLLSLESLVLQCQERSVDLREAMITFLRY